MGPDSTPGPLCTDAGPEARPAPLRQTLELVTLTWIFGSVWQTAITGAPLTRFASELHASPWQFGLLTAMPFLASLLSLPASLIIERTGARKTIFLAGIYFQRLLWFALALWPVWIVSRHGFVDAPRAVFWFLVLTFLMHAGNAVGGPAWVSWMADLVPGRVRGKFFSRRRQWGILPALPVAILVGWFMDRNAIGALPTLQWCAVIFMCAAVFGLADVALFHYVPDVPTRPRRGAGLLRAMAKPLRDRRFVVFAAFTGTMTFALCFMTQFVALYLVERIGVTSSQTQLMLVAGPMLAQLLVLGAWGAAADRMGKKPVLILAGLGLVPVGLGWVLVGPNYLWLGYVLMAAGAALWTGVEVANLNLVMEMAGGGGGAKREGGGGGAEGGTAYVATNSVIINVAGCLGGIAAGLIAQGLKDWSWHVPGLKTFTSYDVLFVLSGVLRLVAMVAFLPHLAEPEAKSAGATFRFLAGNLAAAAAAVLALPARLLAPRAQAEAAPAPMRTPPPPKRRIGAPARRPALTRPPPGITYRARTQL